jgi:translation initiation factor IF-2
VLTAEYASLLAMELNRNPVVNDEAAFDIFPA